jgi:type II secretory pathway predicted ATPase ExeA
VWMRHWGLARDPFAGTDPPYVSIPSHDEALARLVDSIERAQPFIAFIAEAGLGKTTVVRQALRETRNPRRRSVVVHPPSDGRHLLGALADGMGLPFSAGSDRAAVWRSLSRAVRAVALEGTHMVFVLDGWDDEIDRRSLQDLRALMDSGSPAAPPVALIRVGRHPLDDPTDRGAPLTLAIGLDRLTRSQAETYVEARLAAAGCRERIITPRALTRLHSWSEGIPRGLDQLATFSLIAGAVQRLEVVSADVVDGVALRSLVGVNPAVTVR